MNRPLLLPEEVSKHLRCDICSGYLSIPPITTHAGKNSCGRCNAGWPRNSIYEELARFMVFPCTYCDERLPWDIIQSHESKCKKNIFMCPKISNISQHKEYHKGCQELKIVCPFDSCYIMYQSKDILSHFGKYHKEHVFDSHVKATKIMKAEKIWNYAVDTHVCLLLFQQIPFLLFVHSEANFQEYTGDIVSYNYYFSIFSLCQMGCNQRYMVTLELSTTDNDTASQRLIVVKHQEIKAFNCKTHCTNFLHSGIFKHSNTNFMTTKIEHLEKCNNMRMCYRIDFTEEEYPSENNKGSLIDNNRYLDAKKLANSTEFASIIECPICREYLSSPIYTCNTGHTICSKCREHIALCPLCKDFIGNTRNFALEEIVEALIISCFNEVKGCKFTGHVEEIRLHELGCQYNI